MDALSRYTAAKQALTEAQAFATALAAGKVIDVQVSFRIRNDAEGRKNLPDALQRYLEAHVEKKADRIISDAIAVMAVDLQSLAAEVVTEYRAIASDAGVTLPGG